ncbi:MAG: septum formation family protein [Actinomycetota bacterium]
MKIIRLLCAALALGLFATACSDGNVFDLEVGTCFNDPGSTEVSDLPLVDCDEPHYAEVYALYNVTEASLPSQISMFEGCIERFEAAIGEPFATSIYNASAFTPTSGSWDQGDREVVCYAFTWVEEEGAEIPDITGSVLGSGL